VDIRADQFLVEIRMSHPEAERLAFAIAAGYETVSRAEYYIRNGLSQPELQRIVDVLRTLIEQGGGEISTPITPGVETVENPRRPRPSM
jgi:hypothetical protein